MAENLPAVPGGDDLAPLEGTVVEQPPQRPVYVLHVVSVIVRHPVPRTAARHAGYVPAGVVVAWRRWRHARQRPERMMQMAETAGDHAQVIAWRQQLEAERQNRHGRIVKSAETVVTVARNSLLILAAMLGAGVVLSILLSLKWGLRGLVWPWETAAEVAAWAVSLLALGWLVLVLGFTGTVLGVLHELGRRGGGMAPGWSGAAKPDEEERGLVVTADGIVVALQNLSISKLDKAFKEGWQPSFRLTPIKDGEGYSAVFSLPMGVTPGMIADKNEVFARNLHRAKTEVWPTDAERDGVAAAGFVNLWVANPGVLDRPAPDWPLLHSGTADVFKGVPAGVTARGNPVLIPVVGNNFSIGGLMGQGKSNACRVVMLGAALDPLAELVVHVFAYNGDFDCFEPRLARYVKGAEDEQIDAAMQTLGDLYRVVGEREQMLADIGAKKVTRQIAARYPELRPRMVLFSECHELFRHKGCGDEAEELAVAVIRRARKTAVWTGYDTQDSEKDAIPPRLLRLVSVRNCLPVTGWRPNDGFLWDGAFQAGVRATELRAGRDIGRSITLGVSNEQFEILKWHYIFSDDDTGADDARPVIERAMRNLSPGTAAAGSLAVAAVSRDLLADLAMVIDGPWRVSVNELPHRLKRLDATWPEYRNLTGRQLRQRLTDLHVKTTNTDNKPELDPAELHRAIAAREMSERDEV